MKQPCRAREPRQPRKSPAVAMRCVIGWVLLPFTMVHLVAGFAWREEEARQVDEDRGHSPRISFKTSSVVIPPFALPDNLLIAART